MYKTYLKRGIDILLSGIGLIVLLPIFLIVALGIKLDSKGPVLFKQKRIGKDKKEFEIYKFRTMRVDTPSNLATHLLDDPEQWITRIGRFLRKSSLDELPQIWNIFVGDMSIVGPRPALWNQFKLIEMRETHHVHEVLPGLTGWAQINGRDELPYKEKVALDAFYVEHLSFKMDVKIFFGTILKVINHDGVVEGRDDISEERTEDKTA